MEFETIEHQHGQPYKLFLVSIGQRTPHFHRDLEIIYVVKGSIRMHVGNKQTDVREGELFLINPFEIHSITDLAGDINDANLLLIIQIATQSFNTHTFDLSQVRFNNNLLEDATPWLLPMMKTLYFNGLEPTIASDYKRMGMLYTIVGTLIEKCPYSIEDAPPSKTKEEAFRRIVSLIEYVESHYDEPIALDVLASNYHISKYHLSHSVKQTLGISFQTYLNTVRMTKAVQLIYNTKHTILEISERSGFSDQKYLNQMVQHHYGCSASALRKKAKASNNAMPQAPIGSIHLPFDLDLAHITLQATTCSSL